MSSEKNIKKSFLENVASYKRSFYVQKQAAGIMNRNLSRRPENSEKNDSNLSFVKIELPQPKLRVFQKSVLDPSRLGNLS